MDWKKRQYPSGTPVNVTDVDGNSLGVGILLKDFALADEDDSDAPLIDLNDPDAVAKVFEDVEIPEIRMKDGTIILGCDCWWIPVEECKP